MKEKKLTTKQTNNITYYEKKFDLGSLGAHECRLHGAEKPAGEKSEEFVQR